MKIAICAIIKNEHLYLKEWLEYHIALGCKYIHLYEDFGSSSHKQICDEFPNVYLESINSIIDNCLLSKQLSLYNAFIRKYCNVYDWVAFIDIDEFITLENMTLEDVLLQNKNVAGLILFWKIFNANGLLDNESYKVLNTFTETYDDLSNLKYPYKSIVNLKNNPYMITHHLVVKGCNVLGEKNTFSPIYKIMWINHYFTKSWKEWCNRFTNRGDICPGHRKIDEFFIYNQDMLYLKDTDSYKSLKQNVCLQNNSFKHKIF